MAKTKTTGAKAPIRGYDNWTIGEMPKRLGRRTRAELESLLAFEKRGKKRKGAIESIERALAHLPGDRKPSFAEGVVSKLKALVSSKPTGTFDRDRFLDKLSEFLEHERSGVRLYEIGLAKVADETQRDRLEEFAEQTRKHVDVLSGIITDLGGDPEQLSEAAELDRQKAQGLVETAEVEGDAGLLSFFQSLVIAEYVDHLNWEFLEKCSSVIDDEEVAGVLRKYVGEIEDEEDEHYRWAQKQVEALAMESVFVEGEAEPAEDVESDDPEDDSGDEAA